IVAVVDSSGLYADSPLAFDYQAPVELSFDPRQAAKPAPPPKRVPGILRLYRGEKGAPGPLDARHVKQGLLRAPGFFTPGRLRVYEKDTRTFRSSSDLRPLSNWLARNLLTGLEDSTRIERTLSIGHGLDYYTKDREGHWAIKDDAKEIAGFLLPFGLGFLLAMSIITGGQYLLQGVSEEKESRILESMLCSVTPTELLTGKLVGLGGAGLTLVGLWIAAGGSWSGGGLSVLRVCGPASLAVLCVRCFLFGEILSFG